ncbi:MAG: cytochrome c oxidase subunit II [Wenzhouxiangellaceae bacterium]
MKKENYLVVVLAVLAGLCAVVWGMFAVGDNMTQGVTSFSREVYNLHMIILWICVVIGVLVFGAMFVSIILHRKSRGVQPAQFSHSTTAEILWTIIPILILVVMAVPATKTLITMETTGGAEMNIKITGYQWKWKYDYLEDDISFMSSLAPESDAARQLQSGIDPAQVDNYLLAVDNPLVVPINTKVRFLITAGDVIHSWWVPDLGWKRDAIPGIVNEAWTVIEEPGIYRGQCAELCGKDHGFMPIVVEAKTKVEYDAWRRQQQGLAATLEADQERLWARDELMSHGENVYATQCATCHQADGQGLAPAFPALAGSNIATGPVSDHIKVVLQGRSGTAMRGFADVLSPQDIAAALTYTRNAWGNDTGDVVQPSTIAQINNG